MAAVITRANGNHALLRQDHESAVNGRSFDVRPLLRSDAGLIFQFERELYEAAKTRANVKVSFLTPDIERIERWVSAQMRHNEERDLVFLATHSGLVRGIVKVADDRDKGTVTIAVHPEYWKMGIGSAMQEEAIRESRKRFSRLEGVVLSSNERAKRLAYRFGFRKIERPLPLGYEPGQEIVERMVLEL